MLHLISKLQRKPEPIRKRIAFIASALLTGFIVIFWLVGLFSRGISPEPVVAEKEREEEMGPVETLSVGFGAFIDDAQAMFKEMSGLFAAFKDDTEATSTVSE